MVKINTLILLLILLISCSSRNEFGRSRVHISKFSFKTESNTEIYNKLDSCSFYKLVLNDKLIISRGNTNIDLNMIEGFKIYKDGRIGYFSNINIEDIKSFNPKKAIMGLYKYSEKGIIIEYVAKNPQLGINLWRENILKISEDGKFVSTFVVNNGDTVNYKKISIPKEFLIYKPDW